MIGKALKLIRQYHNKSQKDMAQILNISNSYLSEIENNKKSVSFELLSKYSETFSIPMSSILFFYENQNNSHVKTKIASKTLDLLDWINKVAKA